ncbi:HNH endonuclease [Yasminevirus sp. GU-2018]|uniref:HNH endonuclease n=1 Tax=Yasminevirus sp. GU-2018 TaxID=2420051 RepID=A0A5K0UAK1_9VIRU|nr:HNH endonuclease [Yasminevirus sp. GU-2018]
MIIYYLMTSETERIKNMQFAELKELVDTSSSVTDMVKKYLETSPRSYHLKAMREVLTKYDLEAPINKNKRERRELGDILVENSTYSNRQVLANRMFSSKLMENKCAICGIPPIWNNTKLVLQLDHINGINDDNRIENLRMLCPNCHSQTDTYAGKSHKNINKCGNCNSILKTKDEHCGTCNNKNPQQTIKLNVCQCGKNICNNAVSCSQCKSIKERRFEITKEELEQYLFVEKLSFVEIGKKFSVSDNSIRKRCKMFNIDIIKRCKKKN